MRSHNPEPPDDLAQAYASFALAQTHASRRSPQTARFHYEQALIGFARALGPTHVDTITCLSHLTSLIGDNSFDNTLAPHEAYMDAGTSWASTAGSMAAHGDDTLKAMAYFQCLQALQSDAPGAAASLERIVQ